MTDYLWVGLGGFIGANARYAIGSLIAERFGVAFPWHTLFINLTGSFLIGAVMAVLLDRSMLDSSLRLLVVVGFLGGYTTFSSYTLEAITLIERGDSTPGSRLHPCQQPRRAPGHRRRDGSGTSDGALMGWGYSTAGTVATSPKKPSRLSCCAIASPAVRASSPNRCNSSPSPATACTWATASKANESVVREALSTLSSADRLGGIH